MLKKGFTLIELLAVIIILAVVALIATPIVLNVVNSAKDSAMKSQLSLYADSIKNQLIEDYFKNNGKYDEVIELEDDNLDKSVTCEEAHYTKDNKVLLGNCTIQSHNGNYWYVNGQISNTKPSDFDSLKTNAIASNGEIIKEYVDNSGANKPILFDKMIPVVYKNGNWVYANIDKKWYDYNVQEWANAVILNNGVTKKVGDTINVDNEVALMFVWIPRYKYTIFNGNNGSVSAQEINIVFESGIAKTGTVTCTTATSGSGSSSETCIDSANGSIINGTSTYTHPAFTFGTQELTGIWVGKFENSTTDTDCNTNQHSDYCNKVLPVTIKPNVRSWRYAQVANFYTSIGNISTDYGMNVDSHMMKSMEWGATAYLSYSKYGRCDNGTCTEIAKNDSEDYYTGRSQGESPATSDYSPSGKYTYEVSLGQLASTTGNIYGIYDMSGGSWDYVMGNMVNSSNQFYSSTGGFTTIPDSKYYDSYTYDGSSYTTHSRGRLGDATKEVLKTYGSYSGGWYDDWAFFTYSTTSWFIRGGYYSNDIQAGVFFFSSGIGGANNERATRAVVVSADDN